MLLSPRQRMENSQQQPEVYEGPGQKYGEYSVVPCKALYLQGTLLAEQLRRSGPGTRPP
jgi:hypothetical protein